MWLSCIQNCAFHRLRDERKKIYKRKLLYNQKWTRFPPEIRCTWGVERSKQLTWELICFLYKHNDLIQSIRGEGTSE